MKAAIALDHPDVLQWARDRPPRARAGARDRGPPVERPVEMMCTAVQAATGHSQQCARAITATGGLDCHECHSPY